MSDLDSLLRKGFKVSYFSEDEKKTAGKELETELGGGCGRLDNTG